MLIVLKSCPLLFVVKRVELNGAEQVIKRTRGMDKSQEEEYSHLLPNYSLENESPRANPYYTASHKHFSLQYGF